MKSSHCWRVVVISVVCGLAAPAVFGQAVLSKTDLGKSQNTSEDLTNSLIPGKPRRFDKGEKKEEVDPKKLTSKKSNDATFSGSLSDIGLDWTGSQMGKPRDGSNAESKSAKQTTAAVEKDSKPAKSTETSGDSQGKEQRPTSAKSDEKSPAKQEPSPGKSNGDH
jgi:hypothetical protein